MSWCQAAMIISMITQQNEGHMFCINYHIIQDEYNNPGSTSKANTEITANINFL